jgi:thiol-disulfide isomerase/thioredoxin
MLVLNKRSYYVIGMLLTILVVGALVTYFVFLSPTGFKARERADFGRVQTDTADTYTSLSGEAVDLDTYRGDLLIVNVWASWSPFTPQDHEILGKMKSKYGDNVSILAMNRMESKETAEAYLSTIGKKEGIDYIIDGTDTFFNSLGGYAMPETIVFDPVGNIFFHKRGMVTEAELTTAIDTLRNR